MWIWLLSVSRELVLIISLPLQASTVGVILTPFAVLPSLMSKSLWNKVNLDSSLHMTFLYCSGTQSCSFLAHQRLLFLLAQLINGFLKVTWLFGPTTFELSPMCKCSKIHYQKLQGKYIIAVWKIKRNRNTVFIHVYFKNNTIGQSAIH